MSVSVRADNVSKRFRVFHERNQYLKTAILKRRRSRWDDFWAIRDVSFEIHEGEAFGIVGHNGSGKSTMLNCLAGILQPDRGSVQVWGSTSALLELGSGFHPELTGRDNVFLNGALLGMPRRELLRRFDDIVEFAGLSEFIDQPVRSYSTGMTVRLGFAIAITVDPDVLIIDEVLAVGDAEFQAKCRDKITEFRSAGKTIVLVSHGMSDVLGLCDQALWLDHGHMRALGDPKHIVDEYTGVAREGRTSEQVEGIRWGSGEARILSMELIGEDGQPVAFGRTSDELTFRIHYASYERLTNVLVGIALHHQNGQHLSGTNTRRSGHTIPELEGTGYIDYRIPRLSLLEGTYELTAAIQDWTESHDYDHWRHGLRFDVLPSVVYEAGFFSLQGEWDIHTASVPKGAGRVDAR